MTYLLHQKTPLLISIDPRAALLRTVTYHRLEISQTPSAHTTRQRYNALGHLTEQWDPRLSMANQQTRFSLSGQELRSDSVDEGWRVSFFNAAAQFVHSWDGRESFMRLDYDEQQRPVALFEKGADENVEQCVERFLYAANNTEDAQRNRCGRMLRHDDPAGSLWHEAFAVTGQPLIETRRFCVSLSAPHWPDAPLQTASYSTRWQYDALGAVKAQTDAAGHIETFNLDIASHPRASQLDGMPLLKNCEYNAFNQVETEQAGNNVLTIASYSAANGRLLSLKASTQAGHLLQDLHYQYDPVGNVEQIEDMAQPVQWFAQQRVEALSTYRYDTLYQLVEATGRESINQMIGPDLPGLETFGMPDDSRWRNYTQTYTYDSGNNLTQLKHDAGAGHTYLRQMVVDAHSNRSLLKEENPADFTTRFDANGNHLALAPGQMMHWNARNQLHQVTQVLRAQPDGQDNDLETYLYDGEGQRVRKVRRAKTGGGEQISQTLYLPGLEVRESTSGERLHVMTTQAGRNNVQVLHWEAGRPDEIDQDQWRYSLGDHLGSSTLELDQAGELISQETYYPYGGTSWWAARSAVQARYKTLRYSGKERDATGLYYYGYRYYAPFLCRWISPDPTGTTDGLNRYRMVRNKPSSAYDLQGLMFKNVAVAAASTAALGYQAYKDRIEQAVPARISKPSMANDKIHQMHEKALQTKNESTTIDKIENNLSGRGSVITNFLTKGELPAAESIKNQSENLATIVEFSQTGSLSDLDKGALLKATASDIAHNVPQRIYQAVKNLYTVSTVSSEGIDELRDTAQIIKEDIADTVVVGLSIGAMGNAALGAAKVIVPGAAIPITLGQILWTASSVGKTVNDTNEKIKEHIEDSPISHDARNQLFQNMRSANDKNREVLLKAAGFTK
ncbi:RHS repeat domain-containing protein [Pseudomonas psychrophila]|uniref:Insecticidal toxin complex protein TccC n=1 Tax=Pseudomonas psychrophila TaxID=122355 RepID=A0ABY0W4Z4_9PSED|nr:RHS repeat-associated core domain-containing protein [Pseudomonas psychrophila]QIE34617.1 RHS repeat protein [Pseudomonas psychrophila]WVI96726.1 RHS repeat-associated core domain-containing protein [Pseudomonas psychrophila]SDU73165.1 insecticidal toxin complex protein TccC [Pseudomonas psychrophila]